MVKEAEKFKEQDEENKGKIEAKNNLENYLYQMKNSVSEENCKLPADTISTITQTVDETLKWLDNNQNENKQVYVDKLKEVTNKLSPLLQSSSEGKEAPGQFDPSQFDPSKFDPSKFTKNSESTAPTSAPTSSPKIEEVD